MNHQLYVKLPLNHDIHTFPWFKIQKFTRSRPGGLATARLALAKFSAKLSRKRCLEINTWGTFHPVGFIESNSFVHCDVIRYGYTRYRKVTEGHLCLCLSLSLSLCITKLSFLEHRTNITMEIGTISSPPTIIPIYCINFGVKLHVWLIIPVVAGGPYSIYTGVGGLYGPRSIFEDCIIVFFQVLVYKHMLSLKIGCSTYNEIKSIMHLQYTIQASANLFGFHASLCVFKCVSREPALEPNEHVRVRIRIICWTHARAYTNTHIHIYIYVNIYICVCVYCTDRHVACVYIHNYK